MATDPDPLTLAWRDAHIATADAYLRTVDNEIRIGMDYQAAWRAQTLAALASAHYAAAELMGGCGPVTLHTRGQYRIPGLEGVWEIRGLSTADMGSSDPASLDLYRID